MPSVIIYKRRWRMLFIYNPESVLDYVDEKEERRIDAIDQKDQAQESALKLSQNGWVYPKIQ